MARGRKRNGAVEPPNGDVSTPKLSSYEQTREQRIKENRERMLKLGIFDLASEVKSFNAPKPKRSFRKNNLSSPKLTPGSEPVHQPTPIRRSSRLQNVTPVSYSELLLSKKDGSLDKKERILLKEGAKPEIYTEEHEKLLGNTERTWELFVDGCGKDGQRIYDSVKGKTCHQCRQKTLGYRTCCSKCNMVQGQFCGDCLYMRYGEHVLEALEDPDWMCPVCRGICNCSLCRQGKGWAPTGPLYKKILRMGYKSVAHYLVQTKRAPTNTVNNLDSSTQVSAKRSLPFSDTEPSTEPATANENDAGSMKLESEDQVLEKLNSEKEDDGSSISASIKVSTKRSLDLSAVQASFHNSKPAVIDHEINNSCGSIKLQSGDLKDNASEDGEQEVYSADGKSCENVKDSGIKSALDSTLLNKEPERENNKHSIEEKCISENEGFRGSPNLKKKRALAFEPTPDSIAGRLRQRRRKSNAESSVED